jgi:succinyl-diaminopimelate desuccinylase
LISGRRTDHCGGRSSRNTDLAEVSEWLRIPSVSGPSGHRAHLRAAARWWHDRMVALGARVTVSATRSAPVIVAELAGRPGSPLVLVYGHYDVQPPGPGWTVPPFAAVRAGDRLIARGAADDKGQLGAVLSALRALTTGPVRPPAGVVVVADGSEEIGSPGLGPVLAVLARRLRPEVLLVCDTERAPDGVPSVTVSQRGSLRLGLAVDTGRRPVHPGRYGGAVVDPSLVLADVLARWRGVLAVLTGPPLPDQPLPRPVTTRRDRDFRPAAGRVALGSGVDERVTGAAALSVLRMAAGATAGAVPAGACAEVDVRLPPRVDPARVLRRLKTAAEGRNPGAELRVTVRGVTTGGAWTPDPRVLAALDAASAAEFGAPIRLIRSGGSLPAAELLERAFHRPPTLLGLAPPGSGAHGPDEYLDVSGWSLSVRLLIRFLTAPFRSPPAMRQDGVSFSPLSGARPSRGHQSKGATCL